MIRLRHEPSRILLIKPSALGDVVHTLPILRLLRRRFAGAHISWLINPQFAGLIAGHPDLSEVIPFERRRFANSWRDPAAAAGLLKFRSSLRQRRFDLAIDLQGLFRSAWLARVSRAPVRVGFANAREMAPAFYTHRIAVRNIEVHAIERYLNIAEALGCGREPVDFDFAVTAEDRSAVDGMVARHTPFAVLLPGANWPTKRWPAGNFARLVPMLKERLGLQSIVAGAAETPAIAGAASVIGRTTLKQLAALLERAAVVIANDTGPMHIAAALGRPLVAVFGPTSPIRTGPYQQLNATVRLNLPCSPCYSRKCSHQSCMHWLTPEMVMQRIEVACRAAVAT